MEMYFAGAENPTYLRTLLDLDVTRVAISFYEWQRRFTSMRIDDHMPSGIEVVVMAGIARKESMDHAAFGEDYIEFCQANADRALIYDMDAPLAPASIRSGVRRELSILHNVVMFPMEDEELHELARTYERVGINASLSKSVPASELRRLQASLYGSNVTDPKTLRTGRFHSTTSMAWLSGRRYGELWVFARNKLSHYKAENLAKAVRAHRKDIEALGVDPDACAANDKDALTAIAVRSIQAMADSLARRPRDRNIIEKSALSPEEGAGRAVAGTLPVPAGLLSPNGAEPPFPRERTTLPIISVKSQEDGGVVESTTNTVRACDSCSLSSACPKYEEHMACSYSFPVEIKTEDQWKAATQTLLELQFERVTFLAFAEQVDGTTSPRTGQEMDRFMKMLESQKSLEAPPPQPGAGALSKILGELMPQPTAAQMVVNQGDPDADIQEAELIYGEEDDWEGTGEEGGEEGAPEYAGHGAPGE